MADNTKIEWATSSWSPVTGCTPVSEGCQHCYAKRMVERFPVLHGGLAIPFSTPLIHRDRLEDPLHWRKPRRIFVGSMTDIAHPRVQLGWFRDILDIVRRCPQHVFMFLTKRPEDLKRQFFQLSRSRIDLINLPNLWLGVTVESSKYLKRIDILRTIPAAKRFVSFEPMLDVCRTWDMTWKPINLTGIDWAIVGCETGRGTRFLHPHWARMMRDECKSKGIPFFMKKWKPGNKSINDLPEDLRIREIPK